MTLWHLHFDGDPVIVAHICDQHRDSGQQLACADVNESGDCPHVQTRPCQCLLERPCAACLDEGLN